MFHFISLQIAGMLSLDPVNLDAQPTCHARAAGTRPKWTEFDAKGVKISATHRPPVYDRNAARLLLILESAERR
jgi:hypothetical protein